MGLPREISQSEETVTSTDRCLLSGQRDSTKETGNNTPGEHSVAVAIVCACFKNIEEG